MEMYLNSYVPVYPEPTGPDGDEFNFLVKAEHSLYARLFLFLEKKKKEGSKNISANQRNSVL